MPPEGYTTVTLPDETISQISEVMVRHKLDSYPAAVKFAVEDHRARCGELDTDELVKIAANRLE